MAESKKPKGAKLPRPVETRVHEDKRHKVAEYAYKAPKEARNDETR